MRTKRDWVKVSPGPNVWVSRVAVWRSVAVAFLILAGMVCLAPPADAARVRQLLLTEALPEEGIPFALAVDQSTGHFFAAAGQGLDRRIYNFEPNGQLDTVTPELTGAPNPTPTWVALAVDNSGGVDDGYVYASDVSSHTIQQFDANGHATAVTISEAAVPPAGTAQGGGLPPVVNPGGFAPNALAVGASGNVYVNDTESEVIDEFTSAGTFVAQFAPAMKVDVEGMAVADNGDIYVASEHSPLGLGRLPVGLVELNPLGECVAVGCAPIDSAPIHSVALEGIGEVILTAGASATEQGRFSEYSLSTHELMGMTAPSSLHHPLGIAVEESTGELIIGDKKDFLPFEPTVQIYGPSEVVPDVRTLAPEDISISEATFKGEIGAAGVSEAACTFQYVTAEEFTAHRFEEAVEAPCEPAGPFSGTALNSVSAHVSKLRGGTTYRFRILGTNENGTNPGEALEFTTRGPTISGTGTRETGETEVTLEGSVNPRGLPTTYAFQYVTQTAFEAGGFEGAAEIPLGGAPVGEGIEPVSKSQRVGGLLPGTAYRFRLIAVSSEGETQGEDVPFTTFASSGNTLPDGRRYEQVTPTDKNGANVQGGFNSVQASPEGNAVTFLTNTGIPGGEGSQSFPYYISRRAPDSSGWSTQGLLPPASYGSTAFIIGWTEDLASTYDFAARPLEHVGEILRRPSAGGTLTQVGTTETSGAGNPFAFAGASADGGVALLESSEGGLVPGDLPGKQNLYLYDRETGALIMPGVLNPAVPGGEPTAPAGGAMAGSYNWWHGNRAAGGALAGYFTQDQHAISADGKKVFFTAGETGQLYLRENPLASQSAMSGERCTEESKACTIRISAPEEGVPDPKEPAAFVGASVDGSLVYFLDRGKLTADATGGAGYDLYRYDVTNGALTDLSLDTQDKRGARVEGVLGIDASGDTVYFAAAGKLSEEASQAPSGETNIYVFENGEVRLITRLGVSEGAAADPAEAYNWIPTKGGSGLIVGHSSRVSADGHTLLFRSARQLTAYRNQGASELYLYRTGQSLGCISCNPSGQAPTGHAGLQEMPLAGVSSTPNHAFMTRNLSADGRRVFFDTTERLVAADENNVNDVYEWEADGKGSCASAADAGGCLFLISGGSKNDGPSYFGDADSEGENVFFFTAQPLVAQDKDELVDVYDARVGGGIAAQEARPTPPCNEEGDCLPQAEAEPTATSPKSASAAGSNVPPPQPCRKGFVRSHGKCTSMSSHKKKLPKHRSTKHRQSKSRHQGAGKGGKR